MVLCPSGLHVAIIVRVLDLGSQKFGKWGMKPMVRIVCETPDELHEFKEGEGEKPFLVSQDYNRALGDTSHLGKALAGLLGRPLTAEEEAEGVDLAELAGKMVMINVTHSKVNSEGKQFANIASFAPLPKTEKRKLKPFNEIIILDLEPEKFDQAEFNKLPNGVKKKIATSPEYKEVGEPFDPNQPSGTKGLPFGEDDEETNVQEEETAPPKGKKGKAAPAPAKKPAAKTPAKTPPAKPGKTPPAKGKSLFK